MVQKEPSWEAPFHPVRLAASLQIINRAEGRYDMMDGVSVVCACMAGKNDRTRLSSARFELIGRTWIRERRVQSHIG